MKTRTSKLIALAIVMLAFTASTFAQVTATATATANIVTPIAISKSADMNFGNLAVHPTNAGTLVLTPAGGRSVTLGVTLMTGGGPVLAASFAVTGLANATYSISLPASHTINNGGNSMTVNTFTSTPTVAAGGNLGAGGAQTLLVGATLNVSGGQVAGSYTNATGFDVTVNYN